MEAILAHLRFLRKVSRDGGIIPGDEIDKIDALEDKIFLAQQMICEIRDNKCMKEKNL